MPEGTTKVVSAKGQVNAARQVIDILYDISTLLNTQLDRTTLSLCVSLIENGVNPEALASVIKELRRESYELQHS